MRNLVSEGTSTLADGAIQRIASKMQDVQDKRANKHTQSQEPMVKTASKMVDTTEKVVSIRVASINEIPENFERMGTGFYRSGHHLWELTQVDGGFALVRKHGEDHVLGYDPEPIVRQAAVSDRHGRSIKVGSRVTIPHRGKITAGTVIIVQPGTTGVELDSGEKVDTPPDMCELLQEMMQDPGVLESKQESGPEIEGMEHEESEEEHHVEEGSESDTQACQEFEPMVEPSSKADMPHEATKDVLVNPADLQAWQEYWRGMGQHVAQSSVSKPRQTKEEAAMKRKQRRQQRSVERSGLPKGMKVPPKHGALDNDELAKLKERVRLYQQCFDEIEYVLQDESLKTDEVRLADEMDRVMQEYHDQIESMDTESEESREDELSIEAPAEEPVPTDSASPLPKMSKLVVSMPEL